jgi:ribose 5-phosphate isomerase B
MRISLAADELTGIATALAPELQRRGHQTLLHGALYESERDDWAWASEAAARDVADGRAEQGVVCCWTGTGASIAANKVAGVRAALCLDAATAAGARRWNDANVLALSLRSTSEAELGEILDAWLAGEASEDAEDRANVDRLRVLEASAATGAIPELAVDGGCAAIDFYKRALGAEELYRVGGNTEHEPVVCQLAVGAASFWVADASPENLTFSPHALGGGTVRMLLIVADPDVLQARAVAAGASELAAVAEEHGWRLGRILDPFGHQWEIGTPLIPWPPARPR